MLEDVGRIRKLKGATRSALTASDYSAFFSMLASQKVRAWSGDAWSSAKNRDWRGNDIFITRCLFAACGYFLFLLVGHYRGSCFSLHCWNLEPAMKINLDNTIGAAFVGVSASCMWVIHDALSKHHDTTIPQSAFSESPSFKHIYTTTTFPKTGCCKKSRWMSLQASMENIPDAIRLGSSCRHRL